MPHRPRASKGLRRWLLSPEAGFGGNGSSVNCFWCAMPVSATSLSVDKFPICGHMGGVYRRTNVVPSCAPCNNKRCGEGNNAECRRMAYGYLYAPQTYRPEAERAKGDK